MVGYPQKSTAAAATGNSNILRNKKDTAFQKFQQKV